MIYHIVVISMDMYISYSLLEDISAFCYPQIPPFFSLINIIIVYTYKTSTLQVIYYFKSILKVVFMIQISWNCVNVNLNLHPLHFVIQPFSYIKLSYLPLEINLVFIYCIMNTLQSYVSLIQSQIRQTVINSQCRINNVWIVAING